MSDISRQPMSDIGWWWFGLPATLRTVQQKLGAMALELRSPTARSLETKEQLKLTLVLEDSLAKYRCFRNCATVVCGRAMSAWLDSCAFALRNLIQGVVGVLPDYSACFEDQNFDEELAFKITRNKAAAVVRSHSDLLQAMLDIRAKAVALECVPPFGENGLTKEVYAVSVSTCRKHGGLKRNYTMKWASCRRTREAHGQRQTMMVRTTHD